MSQYSVRILHVTLQSPLSFPDYITRLNARLAQKAPESFECRTSEQLLTQGGRRNSKIYVVRNSALAIALTEQDLRCALHLPIRVLIYEDERQTTRIEYSLPSSPLRRFGNSQLTALALELDRRLAELLSFE